MSSRDALLLDVGVEHAAALSGWCARSGLRLVEAKLDSVSALDRRTLAAVVVEVTASREASFEWLPCPWALQG